MTDFASMSARELRSIAPSYGVTGASRMKKDELVEALNVAEQTESLRDQGYQIAGDLIGQTTCPVVPDVSALEQELAETHQTQRIGTRVTDAVQRIKKSFARASGTLTIEVPGARKPFDREARDALKRQPVVLFDPSAGIDDKQYGRRAARNRDLRRHSYHTVMLLDGGRTTKRTNLPKYRREAGLMATASFRDLAKARAELNRAS